MKGETRGAKGGGGPLQTGFPDPHRGSTYSSSRLPGETILSGPRAQWFLAQLSK